jgi:hypothetical protein
VPFNTWGTQNTCMAAGNCRTDSDCSSGYCSPSADPGFCATWWLGYFCHGPGDECVNDGDCTDGGPWSSIYLPFCAFDKAKMHWRCATPPSPANPCASQ